MADLCERTEQCIKAAVEIRLQIARSFAWQRAVIRTTERIAKLSKVQSHETQCAFAIECSEQQALFAARRTCSHEHSLTSASLMQSEKWPAVELLTELFAGCVDRRSKRACGFHFGCMLKSELSKNFSV